MLAHAIAETRVWEFFLDPGLIAANDRPQTAANDGFYGDPATIVYESRVGKTLYEDYPPVRDLAVRWTCACVFRRIWARSSDQQTAL